MSKSLLRLVTEKERFPMLKIKGCAYLICSIIVIMFLKIDVSAYIPPPSLKELSEIILPEIEIDSMGYANVTNGPAKDVVVTGYIKGTGDKYGQFPTGYEAIISYDSLRHKWNTIYNKTKEAYRFEFRSGPVLPDREIVIFATWGGMGRFMDYDVIAYVDGAIKVLMNRESLSHGYIDIYGNQILESEDDCAILYRWDGKSLVGTPLATEPILILSPLDKVVQYSIDDHGRIVLSNSEVTLLVGQRLHLQRIKCGTPQEIQFSCDWNLMRLGRKGIYAEKAGSTILELNLKWGNWRETAKLNVTIKDTLEYR